MSCVCIITPLMVAAWPAFSAAVVAATSSLGYQIVAEGNRQMREDRRKRRQPQKDAVSLEIANSQLVTDSLGRDQHIKATRDGVTVAFARDARGKASICVSGGGLPEERLRELGREISQRVVQSYVYQRLKEEIQARQFVVVEEETDAEHAIHLKVRHWET